MMDAMESETGTVYPKNSWEINWVDTTRKELELELEPELELELKPELEARELDRLRSLSRLTHAQKLSITCV